MARSSSSRVPWRYVSISWPVPVVRSSVKSCSAMWLFVLASQSRVHVMCVCVDFFCRRSMGYGWGGESLTWEFDPLDGHSGFGEVRGEELCLCGLA